MRTPLPQRLSRLIKFSSRVFPVFTAIFLLSNYFVPLATYAAEESNTDQPLEEEQSDPNEVNNAEQDSSNPQDGDVTSQELPSENDQNPNESVPASTWTKEQDGTFVTTAPVEKGKEYEIQELGGIKIVFTSLPENSGELRIKEVGVPSEIDGEEVVGKAYDISSTMSDGTFTYDLYMPNAGNTDSEVKYSEDGSNFTSINGEHTQNNYTVITDLDHFTVFVIFVVVNPNTVGNGNTSNSTSCNVIGDGYTCYDTIQGAINAANNGDTIQVMNGTYSPITVNKSVILTNGSSPVIDCGGSGNGILIQAPDVTIDGFEITNCTIGIRTYGGPSNFGDLTIKNSHIHSNSQNGILMVYDVFNTVTLENLLIEKNSQNGIGIANNSTITNLLIKNSDIKENGHNNLFFANTIISSISISESEFSNTTSWGSGIQFGTTASQIGSLQVSTTEIKNNAMGVAINQASSTFGNITFDNTSILNNRESGILLGGGTNSERLIIKNSTFQGNGWEDLDISGGWFGSFNITNFAEITQNNFYPSAWAKIYVGNTGSINSLTIKENNFYGAETALFNSNAVVADVDLNWWGSYLGPGAKLSGPNQYQEWLCEPYETDWISTGGICTLSAPTTLGWNVSGLTNNPGEIPTKLQCGASTNDNTPSHVWQGVSGQNVKYQRQAQPPSGGWWTDPTAYTNTNTPFLWFGDINNGWEGGWNTRVKAWVDSNDNGIIDQGELVSNWSNECTVTYDKTAPATPTGLERKSADGTKTYACGAIAQRQTLIPDWADNTESDFSHYEYTSFNPDGGIGIDEQVLTQSKFVHTWVPPVDGTYGYAVRTVDKAGNKSDWALSEKSLAGSCQITYDSTPPTAPTILFPNPEQYFSTAPILNDWSVVIDASEIAYYRIEYVYDDGHSFSNMPYRTTTISQRDHSPAVWEEGGVKFRVQAFDNAGNEGAWSDWRHYFYDLTPPVTTLSSPQTNSNWNKPIKISGSSVDTNLTRSVNLYYRESGTINWIYVGNSINPVDTAAFNWEYNWTPPYEGIFDIKAAGIDEAGNEESSAIVLNITYDTTPPAKPTGLKWQSQDRTMDFACNSYTNKRILIPDWDNNAESDFDHYEYTSFWPDGHIGLNETVFFTSEFVNSWPAPIEGTFGYAVRAVDKAGNKSGWALTSKTLDGSCKINLDFTSPTSTVYIQGDLDETKDIVGTGGWHGNGWYESYDNVNLQIVSGDPLLDFTRYQILAGDTTCPDYGVVNGYSAPQFNNTNGNSDINGRADAVYTLCYYAEDLAGNTENSIHKQLLKKDNTNPTYSIDSVTGVNFGGVYYANTSTVTIGMTANDIHSGYTRARYDLYNADASHTCTTYVGWNEDNLAAQNSVSRNLVKSGLADGNYCMRVWIYDDVQNKAWTPTNGDGWVKFVIDTTAPTVDLVLPVSSTSFDAVFSEDVNVVDATNPANYFLHNWPTAGGSGDLVGDANITYDSDTKTATITFTSPDWYISPEQEWGVQDVHDLAGNVLATSPYSETSTPMVAPVTTASGIDAAWHNTPVTVSFNCTDLNGSGCYKTYSSIDSGTFVEGTSVDITTDGQHTVAFYSVDNAGNIEGINNSPQTVNVDSTSPTDPSGFSSSPAINTSSNDNTVNVSWSVNATDNLSGVDGYSYSFTNNPNDVPDPIKDIEENIANVTSTALADGAWYFHIRTVDNAGNWTSTAHYGPFSVDTIGPAFAMRSLTRTAGGTIPNIGDFILSNPENLVPTCTPSSLTRTDMTVNSPLTTRATTITCTVRDNAGNETTTSAILTVNRVVIAPTPVPVVAGAATTNGAINGAAATTEQTNTSEESVLGEQVCDVKSRVSGYVYFDENNNGQKDSKEKGLQGVGVEIYSEVNGSKNVITSTITDDSGYWEVQLCPGSYKANVLADTLSSKEKVLGSDTQDLEVKEGMNLSDVDFTIQAESSTNWALICLVSLFGLAVIAAIVVYLNKRKGQRIG